MDEDRSGSDPGVSPVDYDAELQLLNQVLRTAYDIERHDKILDIGCGAGQTTREAARMAFEGAALGIDLSAKMIDRARALACSEGIGNVTFLHGDAQTYPFPSEDFDLVVSRFGTMFFQDPVAAFANVRHALRPGGRLVMMTWQGHEQNEWSLAIEEALEGLSDAPVHEAADPFSLADPAKVEGILEGAGFTDVSFTAVDRPIYWGQDATAALQWIRGFMWTRVVFERLDTAMAQFALSRLRETLASHTSGDGVWFDSRAWIVEARSG
jgi:SAM-dependent methyltransferase